MCRGVPMLCDDAIVETFCQCGEKDKSTVAHLRSIADRPDMVCRNCNRSFLSFRHNLMDVVENDAKYPFERLWLLRKVSYTLFTPGAENPWVKLYENCL